jgi:mono/diheme cytochrome c family protein
MGRSRWRQPLAAGLGLAGMLVFGYALTAAGADVLPVGQFYQRYCARCHGAHGNNPALAKILPGLPDFADPNWEATHTKAELTKIILHGKGAMPAFQGDLRGHTPAELVDFLREFSGKSRSGASKGAAASADPAHPGGSPMPVAQFYQRYCSNCHGAEGKNPKLARIFPKLPDFADPNWEATHTRAELTRVILHGKGAMPAFKGDLRGHTPGEVIDYLRAFSKQGNAP